MPPRIGRSRGRSGLAFHSSNPQPADEQAARKRGGRPAEKPFQFKPFRHDQQSAQTYQQQRTVRNGYPCISHVLACALQTCPNEKYSTE